MTVHEFHRNGFAVVKDLFDAVTVRGVQVALLQALGAYDKDDLGDVILQAEAADHDLVYRAGAMAGSSAAAYDLIGRSRLAEIAGGCLRTRSRSIHFLPLHVLAQIPQVDAFDYRWHQESAFYPWADHVLNVWFPLLDPSTVEGGTMLVIPGSHKTGARDAVVFGDSFKQIESVLSDGEENRAEPILIGLGDAVVFDANLVHASAPNRSDRPRVTGIVRVVDQKRLGVRQIVGSLER